MIDHSLYPDELHGDAFSDEYDRADYVHRVCSASDFGVFPLQSTIEMLRGWRDVFDKFPIAASPSYHTLRGIYGWPEVERLRSFFPTEWESQDRLDGRSDPCHEMV